MSLYTHNIITFKKKDYLFKFEAVIFITNP